ncbi:MAG: Hemolysin A [Opitutia bacterium UBA7350]|nr:MAG: Hemolysin A [Opitutae bacterium UBA7350]
MATLPKIRLDELLLLRGLADSRSQAKALILAGKVHSASERLDKPGRTVSSDLSLEVVQAPRFVSRGGEKIEGFLDRFSISMKDYDLLDVGASTGGFTDCCLQRGALSATCVDVGRAQLHNKLLQDPRVTNLEKVNARHLKLGDLPRKQYPRIVMDLSFISLTKILPAVWPFCASEGILIALVKPQFEAEKIEVDAGRGIIRDPAIQTRILKKITAFALRELAESQIIGTMESPIKGTDGNLEYLLGLGKV